MRDYGFIRCAIANFNSELANVADATKKIKSLVSEAAYRNVKLLVFPELCMTGYTCQDLFQNSRLLEETLKGLDELESFSSNHDILFLVGAPLSVSDCLFNCAVAIQNGKIRGVIPKQYIPDNENCFTAYTPTTGISTINLFGDEVPFGNLIISSNLGYKLGVEIGDDLWSVIPPSSHMALAGANIIANLSASCELVGKDERRRELIKTQSSKAICAYLYTSAGFSESTDSLVFGGSGYIYENGQELTSFERFQMDANLGFIDIDIEDLRNSRISNTVFKNSKRNLSNSYQEVPIFQQNFYYRYNFNELPLSRYVNTQPFAPTAENCSTFFKEILDIQSTALARRLYATKSDAVTIGVSGGLDSTLALIVIYEAFNKLNLDLSGIIAVTMPGFGTTDRTHNNADKLCTALGISLKEISINDACIQHFKDIEHDPSVHDITYENAQARERTQILMDLANKHNAILVGTGDLSEIALGWCTYNGDHMSMYGVNSSIEKTLMKSLIEWYANQIGKRRPILKETLLDIVSTPISPELLPTDGKEVVQKTENSVGPYEVIDFFIYYFVVKHFSREKILFLAEVAFAGKYSADELSKYYDGFITRFFRNQFKRNCSPDGPRVGAVSLSPSDWRMPSDI